jgi:hypothetical protein
MLNVELLQAIADGLLDPEEAVKLTRHPGGRPKGAKNAGPDALAKAIAELSKQRSRMTADEIAVSERRIAALLKPRGKRGHEDKDLAARATKAEKLVAGVYVRQEDRLGMSRKRYFKTDSEESKYKYGYVAQPAMPYPECVRFVDVGLRMERHPNGWLAPITETGKAGHAYAVPDATLAEHYAAWLSDPSQESDWSGCPLDEAGEFIPATYEFRVTNALTYAVCKAKQVFPKANGTPVVHKKPACASDGCHRGAYKAPLTRFLPSRRTAEEKTKQVTEEVWCNGVHIDDLLKIATTPRLSLPVIQPVVAGFLPKRLDIAYSMADWHNDGTIVWFRDYEGPGPLHA